MVQSMSADRRPADPGREEFAARLRSEALSPEEWAARYAHTVGSSSLDDYRYSDPSLDEWIRRMHAVLRSPSLLKQYRDTLLTQEERDEIEDEASGPF
jgi:hypothetical protein